MANVKVNDTTVFPATTPATDDLLFGTDVSDTATSVDGQVVNFTVREVAKNYRQVIDTWDAVGDNTHTVTIDPSEYSSLKVLGEGLTTNEPREFDIEVSDDGGSTWTLLNSVSGTAEVFFDYDLSVMTNSGPTFSDGTKVLDGGINRVRFTFSLGTTAANGSTAIWGYLR